jgi:predicted dehydrogenase
MTSSTGKLRYGLLGAGYASSQLILPALRSCSRAQVSAVASRDPARARRLAQEFGCAAAGSYEELIRRDDVDVVYIGLPTGLHAEWALRALQAGKHVHCEKIFAPFFEEARRVLQFV